ncbi:MAG: transglutaminase-like domain-containing protein, partial [Lachnospiraceae bacterium]|nr:transglutaminase-like domain-containing protein [Lachnospiraceae bacterium]
MKRVGFIFIIYFSIIYAICTGFKVESYRGFVLILAVFFFLYWNIVSSDFFYEHKLLRPIQYVQYFVFAGYVLFERRQLLRGGAVVFNYFFDIVNQTFHRQFTYYLNVQEETAGSDMVIFCIIILALYSGILVLSRRHAWLVVLETMPVMFLIMVFTPQAIHADFFLYLAGIFGLYYVEHSKIKMAIFMFSALGLVAIFFEVYPSTEIFGQKMSNIRQGTQVVFEYVNHIINGEQSIFALNFGDLKNESVKKSDSDEKAIVTIKSVRDDILLRSYVGESYQNGKWDSKHRSAMDVALLEDQKKISELKLDRFRPHVDTMKISYPKGEKILCYPYYTVGRNQDGDIEYFNVGDQTSFLARAQEMSSELKQQDEYNEKEEDKRYQMEQNKNCKLPSSLQKNLERVTKSIKKDSKTEIELIQNLSRYMKENYTYTSSAGMTPEGKDPADYFLFQSMRGDCSQYASATVLLLRSMDIPARYVEGYRLGDEVFKEATMTNGWMVLRVTPE